LLLTNTSIHAIVDGCKVFSKLVAIQESTRINSVPTSLLDKFFEKLN